MTQGCSEREAALFSNYPKQSRDKLTVEQISCHCSHNTRRKQKYWDYLKKRIFKTPEIVYKLNSWDRTWHWS